MVRDLPGVTNIFIYAEFEDRVKRCVESYGDDPETVETKIRDYDKARANYYNFHTSQKWGQLSNYNLAINTSYISDEKAADLIVQFMNTRIYRDQAEKPEV